MTCPRPQKSLGQSRIRNWVSTSKKLLFWVTALYAIRWSLPCGLVTPVEPGSLGVSGQGRTRQSGCGRMGAGSRLGAAHSLSDPTRMAVAAAAGACVAMGLGLRADADRPPLPHASRTNKTLRSGLCEGLVAGRERRARGLAVALGDPVLVFRERAQCRTALRQPPPGLRASAADTSAAREATAGAHLACPSLPGHSPPSRAVWLSPQRTPQSLCQSPGSAPSYTASSVPAPRHTYTHAHSHLSGPRLLGANIDSEEAERPNPLPARLRSRARAPPGLGGGGWGAGRGGVLGTWAPLEQHQMSLFHPLASSGGWGERVGGAEEQKSKGHRLPGGGWGERRWVSQGRRDTPGQGTQSYDASRW